MAAPPLFVECSGQGGSDDEGPFRFDCNSLEVKLSPRSRERETSNAAADATFETLVTEVCEGIGFCARIPYIVIRFVISR